MLKLISLRTHSQPRKPQVFLETTHTVLQLPAGTTYWSVGVATSWT
jgi:hypothetical protein